MHQENTLMRVWDNGSMYEAVKDNYGDATDNIDEETISLEDEEYQLQRKQAQGLQGPSGTLATRLEIYAIISKE